jgi:hypothetical protein|nr:putative recombinase [uncultured Mediterranean phage uvMED]
MKLRPQTEEKSKGGMKERRQICLKNIINIPTVNIKGKKYSTVNERLKHLLQYFPEARFNEEILFHDNERVIVKTELYIGDTIFSVGTAEEWRNSSFINKTSALENCSSSALGRCLAAFGLSGSEYASAEELVNALNNQSTNTQSTTKKVSIEDEIKKQTTETKLTALYSNWKKNNNSDDKIEKLFEQQQQSIKTNGGQNAKQW